MLNIVHLRAFVKILAYFISYVTPRSSRKIVLGGWFGDLYGDNPKYFLLYILANTDLYVKWIGKDNIAKSLPNNPRVEFIRKGSLSAVFHILTTKMIFCSHMTQWDFTEWPIFPKLLCRLRIANAWHGIPIKRMGNDLVGGGEEKSKSFNEKVRLWFGKRNEYLSVSSDDMGRIISSGWPRSFSESRVLKFGTPRNDFLLKNKSNKQMIMAIKKKYAKLLDFSENKKIVLYLPTWRTAKGVVRTFYGLSVEEKKHLGNMLEKHDAVLLEKHHYMTYVNNMPKLDSEGLLRVIRPDDIINIDVQELLLIADILISDYSGAFIDFGLLGRPVIHYVYDYLFYKNQDTGLAYELKDVAAGPIAYEFDTLLDLLDKLLGNPVFTPAPRYYELVKYEKGDASKRILEFLLGIRKC